MIGIGLRNQNVQGAQEGGEIKMLSFDLQQALCEPYCIGDCFSVKLIRLIIHADIKNFEALRSVFPIEVRAVELYRLDCPYASNGAVCWNTLSKRAYAEGPRLINEQEIN